MTHPRLSVDAMCTFRWSFDRDLALWSDMGVRHAGLLITKLAPDPAAAMARLTTAGIKCSTLITESFDLNARDTWGKTHEAHRTAIDLVASQGGHSIYFTPGRTTTISWQEDFDRLAEALDPTVAYGHEKGVLSSIEPSLRTSASFVNTLRDAIDVAERTGIKLVVDFANVWMERDFRETIARAMPHISLMQIDDVVIGGQGRPSPGGRIHIDQGELPLRRMMQDVLDAGYTGVFDLEVVAADFSADCDEDELRRGIDAASALLSDMGI
ncbi:MAG TPA: sugar phosphate isomerase/epimerase [Sphingobium sp.]|uniref:sugar phosphate isomerase/epimerase family protein n=1 Tax=Sphingobium sp. TaxID=1912891 RepID=UPI002ED4C355